jgi:hypothetical protein
VRANGGSGIDVSGASVTIGGTSAASQRNVVGNLGAAGIAIKSGATGALVVGNYIGADSSGVLAAGNAGHGIQLGKASGLQVGGLTTAARNVIVSNGLDGIGSDGAATPASTGGWIKGNLIGGGRWHDAARQQPSARRGGDGFVLESHRGRHRGLRRQHDRRHGQAGVFVGAAVRRSRSSATRSPATAHSAST